MRNTVGQSRLLNILPRRLFRLREIENGRLELRVCCAEGQSVSPAASAHVEQSLPTSQINAFCHQTRRAERSGMLGRAELLPTNSRRIEQALIKTLVREDTFASKCAGKVPEGLVAERSVDQPNVVPGSPPALQPPGIWTW